MATSTATENVFSHIKTIEELTFEYEVRSSPENVYRDGEATYTEAMNTQRFLRQHYDARVGELIGDAIPVKI